MGQEILNPFVADACFALSWFYEDERKPQTYAYFERLNGFEAQAFVPKLWITEILSSFLIGVRRSRISPQDAKDIVESLKDMPIDFVDMDLDDNIKVFDLAKEYGLSSYDATYLYLARKLNLPLATLDEKLTLAANATGVKLVA